MLVTVLLDRIDIISYYNSINEALFICTERF